MKKLLAIFIAAVIILGAVEVVRKPSAQQIVDDFDSIVHVISLTQITEIQSSSEREKMSARIPISAAIPPPAFRRTDVTWCSAEHRSRTEKSSSK